MTWPTREDIAKNFWPTVVIFAVVTGALIGLLAWWIWR